MATEQELTQKQEAKPEAKQEKQARKFVHLSTSTTNTGRVVVTALCNDGTIWFRDVSQQEQAWAQLRGL